MKGYLTEKKLEILESNENEDFEIEIYNRIHPKIPKFVFEKIKEPRTMIFEDFLGYDVIKFYYQDYNNLFLLIRIEGKFNSSYEIKKFSLKINLYLGINLNFSI